MRVLCTLAQRNEVECLEPWVRYHAYTVGVENLHIIDNASDDPYVVEKINEYEKLGIGITRIPPGTDFTRRGMYTAEVIQKIEAERPYDFVFPMDCDEFLAVYDFDGKPSCRREDIMNYLHGLQLREGVYQIAGGLENVNNVTGKFIWRGHFKKAFFSSRQCLNLDVGYHMGFPRNGLPLLETNIFYVHFQLRPYAMFRRLAHQKLAPFIDPDDREALMGYTGANFHLAPLFLLDEEGYNAHLDAQRTKEREFEKDFPGFELLMRILGLNPNVLCGG
jgi:hypothetical protein